MSNDAEKAFVACLADCLRNKKYSDAVELVTKEDCEMIEAVTSEIVSFTCDYFTEDNVKHNKELFECCKIVLNTIAEKSDPMGTTLGLLEQMEYLDNDIKFCAILEPLGISMIKMEDKTKAIEWCISTIRSYIIQLAIATFGSDESNNHQEECKCTEMDENENCEEKCCRVINIYKTIVPFIELLVQEALRLRCKSEEECMFENCLLSLLISLFGKPFCYLYKRTIDSTIYKHLSERLITSAVSLTGDILYFLNIVSHRYRKIIRNRTEENEENIFTECYIRRMLFELSDNISNLAYANFYYYIFTEEIFWENIPQVYNPHYIFEMSIYLVRTLCLEGKSDNLILKGLTLTEHIIKRTPRRSVSSEILQLEVYIDIFPPIVHSMIFDDDDVKRKKALHVFYEYIEVFNMEARYTIISCLYNIEGHSGLLSLLTSIFKSSIIECLESNPRDPNFLGTNMEWLLKKICKLPHGSLTDLVEISDEIITALNLLRFLFIRDKQNETGIWNIRKMIENDYLEPLRQGINLCREHWRVKIKDLEQQRKNYTKIYDYAEMQKADAEVTLTVGGEQVPAMPFPEKISFCYQAVNGLDVMESILIRVNECINAGFRHLWTSRTVFIDQFENGNHGKENPQQFAHEESDEDYEKNIKTKILSASLKFVPDLGWSKQAISAGAEAIGYPGIVHGLFPNGGAALVQHFYSTCNYELTKILKKEALAIQEDPSKPRKTLEHQVRDAVVTRLRMIIPYKKTWPQAIAIMTLPPNVLTALANLLTLVDDICYYAGDRSVDFNWYTRRMMLATIYKTTELYMLQDTSEDHKETWLFLERRIKEASQIHAVLCDSIDMSDASPDKTINLATDTVTAAFVTARNILGLNWNR